MIPFGLIYLMFCESDKAVTVFNTPPTLILFHMMMVMRFLRDIPLNSERLYQMPIMTPTN